MMNVTVSKQSVDPRLEFILAMILGERESCRAKHGPMRGPHEAWGVIDEEFDDFKDELRANNMEKALEEAIQCATAFINFMMEVVPTEMLVRAYGRALLESYAPQFQMADGRSKGPIDYASEGPLSGVVNAMRMGERL